MRASAFRPAEAIDLLAIHAREASPRYPFMLEEVRRRFDAIEVSRLSSGRSER